ncbi:hypothetical protein ACIPVK_12090 [Paeniglutamicibacter sp. MACA_103]|uniref:hypothetical protein n=1 Tax=Paeniglutamicibacter sp. MACA_103 TaxID=3377337 RepID=UPI0038932B1D
MPHDSPQDPHRLTRRGLLSLAALAAGGVALSPPHLPVRAPAADPTPPTPGPTVRPTPTAKPGPPPWRTRDPLLRTPLKPAANTRGAISRFEGAFPALSVKAVVPLPGLTAAPVPWLAVSIVGPVNQLQIVNPDAGAPAHVVTIPGSHNGGIESMAWHRESKTLYLCTGGNLLSWSPGSPKQARRIGTVPGATTLYELQLDSAGNLWGGTYPLGATFTYAAATKRIRVHKRLAADSDYVRRLAIGPDDQVWAGTGSRNPRLFTFPASNPGRRTEIQLPEPMPNGFISSIDVLGNRVAVSASDVAAQLLLDPRTGKWAGKVERVWAARRASGAAGGARVFTISKDILYATDTTTWRDTKLGPVGTSSPLVLASNGKQVLVASQIPTGLRIEFFTLATGKVDKVRTVSLTDGEFTIQSLLGHSDGSVYVGGYMGKGLAAVNPDTGARWHSPDEEDVVNQIEGMIEFDPTRSYLGSYGSADIIGLDSRKKGRADGYVRLERLSRKYHQSRPFGWAVNSRNVFFGTVPDYGRAGGVLGMIDPRTNKVAWVLDGGGTGFVKAHSIIGLAADERYLYGTSSVRNGYGIPDTKGPAKVFKLEIATKKKIWETAPVTSSGALYAPKLIAGWLVVADIEGINIIDPANGKLVRRHRLTQARNAANRPGWANADIAQVGDGSKLVHSAKGTTTVVDFRAGTKSVIGSPRGKQRFGSRLAAAPSGRVFGYTEKTVLVELDLIPRPVQAKRPAPTPAKARPSAPARSGQPTSAPTRSP